MRLARNVQQALVFDLGGTYLRCGVWSASSGMQATSKTRIESFVNGHDSQTVWNNILCRIQAYEATVRTLTAASDPIVIAFPGPVRDRRHILSAPTVLGDETRIPDLAGQLEMWTGRRVYLLNDVSAAAWHFSVDMTVTRFMVVTVSSGIGSKLFDKSHPAGVIDSPSWAGEIGHIVVDDRPEAPVCDCGGSGHLGAIASGRGIEREARRHAAQDPRVFCLSACATQFGGTPATLNNEDHIVPGALADDAWCREVIRRATKPLARVILALIVGAGLERVKIMGGFALSLGDVYLQILREEIIAECQYSVLRDEVGSLVELGDVGEEACLMGAGEFANQILACRQ
jgi:C7-cyclitol 7-kinase